MSKDDKSEEYKGPGRFTSAVGRGATEGGIAALIGAAVGGIADMRGAEGGAKLGLKIGATLGGLHGAAKGASNAAKGEAQYKAEAAENRSWQAKEDLRRTVEGAVGRG